MSSEMSFPTTREFCEATALDKTRKADVTRGKYLKDLFLTARTSKQYIERPYCLISIQNGTLLLLNRDYKPMGMDWDGEGKGWAVYDDPQWAHLQFQPNQLKLESLYWQNGQHGNGKDYYLHTDTDSPNRPGAIGTRLRKSYVTKLEQVFSVTQLNKLATDLGALGWTKEENQ